jgi:hypothetical protein
VYHKTGIPGKPVAPPLKLGDAQSLSVTPYHIEMLHCDKSKPQYAKRTAPLVTSNKISGSYQLSKLGWNVATVLSRMEAGKASSNIPGWTGYNSLLSQSKPLTDHYSQR